MSQYRVLKVLVLVKDRSMAVVMVMVAIIAQIIVIIIVRVIAIIKVRVIFKVMDMVHVSIKTAHILNCYMARMYHQAHTRKRKEFTMLVISYQKFLYNILTLLHLISNFTAIE